MLKGCGIFMIATAAFEWVSGHTETSGYIALKKVAFVAESMAWVQRRAQGSEVEADNMSVVRVRCCSPFFQVLRNGC
jgi:hypothetical protein